MPIDSRTQPRCCCTKLMQSERAHARIHTCVRARLLFDSQAHRDKWVGRTLMCCSSKQETLVRSASPSPSLFVLSRRVRLITDVFFFFNDLYYEIIDV